METLKTLAMLPLTWAWFRKGWMLALLAAFFLGCAAGARL